MVPVTYRRTQSGACDLTTTAAGRLQVSGGYRSQDGTLALRLNVEPEAGRGTCGGGAQCPEELWAPPERPAALCVQLASGRYDALSGRFVGDFVLTQADLNALL